MWFVRGRWDGGPGLLAQFPALEAWEQRVAAIGHGAPTDMLAAETLDVAAAAELAGPENVTPGDSQALALGAMVTIVPDEDGGDPAVAGIVRFTDRKTIGILYEKPRVGYRVTAQ